MSAKLRHRSFRIGRRSTSLALEPRFWSILEQAALERRLTLTELIEAEEAALKADPGRAANLSSALRLLAVSELERKGAAE